MTKPLPRCAKCREPLIERKQPDGSIHTWHRDRPCQSPDPMPTPGGSV